MRAIFNVTHRPSSTKKIKFSQFVANWWKLLYFICDESFWKILKNPSRKICFPKILYIWLESTLKSLKNPKVIYFKYSLSGNICRTSASRFVIYRTKLKNDGRESFLYSSASTWRMSCWKVFGSWRLRVLEQRISSS